MYMFLNINPISFNPCSIYPHCGILTYQWHSPMNFVGWNLLWYPHVLYSSNICETLLYNRQLVVITYELICVIQAAHRKGKIIVKWDYFDIKCHWCEDILVHQYNIAGKKLTDTVCCIMILYWHMALLAPRFILLYVTLKLVSFWWY